MEFIYKEEEMKNCWYKDVCPYYKEEGCTLSFCQRHYKMEYLTYNAMLRGADKYPIKLYPDPDGTDREAFVFLSKLGKEDILEFVSKGRNLVICSKICGNGKSSWAKKLIFYYLDKIWHKTEFECRALFIDMPKFLNELKGTFGNKNSNYVDHIRDNIIKADLVVWDEIGLKNISDTEIEYLLNYMNTRFSEGKANIFTTNLNDDTLQKKLGDRLYSRVINNSKVIELFGKDKRSFNKW